MDQPDEILPTYEKKHLRIYENVFLVALAQLPGYFSAAYLIEPWGRRPTLFL